ncbi:MAG: anhydro-N-acetylmuramic acid kinase [Chitinophagaceae bacterium]
MLYKVIGLMSGSSLDGLDLAFVHLQESAGNWSYEIVTATCFPYSRSLRKQLQDAPQLSAREYLLLHSSYGHYLGQCVLDFREDQKLTYGVDFIASHGHTSFHLPEQKMTAQLGDGAAIAAQTGLPVMADLRSLDVALGGQGAPIVPIGEKYLFGNFELLLNLGGIANITSKNLDHYIAFDICAVNRVLNHLAQKRGMEFDENGRLAQSGELQPALLEALHQLPYYSRRPPKSLANEWADGIVIPLLNSFPFPVCDQLRTYVEHIAQQIVQSIQSIWEASPPLAKPPHILVTGGGAFNSFLMYRIKKLAPPQLEWADPDPLLISYKEALIVALLGTLRWREQNTTLHSVTGASRDSVGGALWMGLPY